MPPKLIAKLKNAQLLKLFNSIFPDRTSIVIFLLAFTLLLTFWQVGLLLNDEWITANQLTNLKNGSLTVDEIKYGTDRGIYNIGGKPVGAYTHALPAMNYLHGIIAYHAGLKFFMDTVLSFSPLSTQI